MLLKWKSGSQIGAASVGAASTSQAVYHVSKIKKVLEGNVEKQQWARETARMSSLLYDAGRELGAVCQSKETDTGDTFSFFAERQKRLFRDIAAISEESVIGHGKQGR
jgi:hypothetical protein